MNNKYTPDDFEEVIEPEFSLHVFVCINCGAMAGSREGVKHYSDCKPGEAKKWIERYDNAEDEEKEEARNDNRRIFNYL